MKRNLIKFVCNVAILFVFTLTSCQTRLGQAVQKWEIAHRPQIEQTAFLIAQDVGQLVLSSYLKTISNSGKFTFAAYLRSMEGNYTNPQQVSALLSTWGLNNPSFNQAASFIAADLANHPPTNQAMAMAKLEGYISGIAPLMGVAAPPSTP